MANIKKQQPDDRHNNPPSNALSPENLENNATEKPKDKKSKSYPKRDKNSKEYKTLILRFREWTKRDKDILMFITQVFLVIGSFASVWIIYYMTSKQIDKTEQMNKPEMRAYISVSKADFFKFRVGDQIKMNINITNTGRTPAHHISWTGIVVVNNIQEDSIANIISRTPHEENFSLGGTVPFIQKQIMKGYVLQQSDSLGIIKGTIPFYVIGEFVYEDIFGEKHFTHYCQLFDAVNNSFYMYGHYNDTN
jgi:hypothetical protein